MAKFTRQHYIAAAKTLAKLRPLRPVNEERDNQSAKEQWRATVTAFAGLFASDNVNFKRDIFYAACHEEGYEQ